MAQAQQERKFCPQCNRTLVVKEFYKRRDGTHMDKCKKCTTLLVDNFKPETFTWILEEIDVPYVPTRWNDIRNKAYAKAPEKMTGTTVLGKYLSQMRLGVWAQYGWADSERLTAIEEEKKQKYLDEHPELRQKEDDLEIMYKRGEISEAQYKTFASSNDMYSVDIMQKAHAAAGPQVAPGQPMTPFPPAVQHGVNPYEEQEKNWIDDGSQDLTAEDKKMLTIKWGELYKPSEWIKLEKHYTEMINGFDIQDPDTEGTLKVICKTYLKMNQALDMGDMDSYSKLSRVYNDLRKTAKFTAAQNKEEESDFVDCVGNLVDYCEKTGGRIKRYEIKAPKDVIDKGLELIKKNAKDLIEKDQSLARQIEEYLKKKEIQEQMDKDQREAEEKGLTYVEMDDEDLEDRRRQIEEEKEADQEVYNERRLV